ncbi:MAG TPA: TonB-dependent receptor, partial [Longimicrobium sp.]|nr:TonB-dependent receptor [Longimicrobium sp.]
MKNRRSQAAAMLLWALLAVLGVQAPAAAQGVTTSALGGTVTGPQGQPLAGAQVTVRNNATGTTRTVATDEGGRYFVGNLLPGGPYSVSASRLGFGTQQRTGVTLVLSQTATANFQLQDQTVVLEALTVNAAQNPAISRSRTGAGTVLGSETVEELPTINRNFTELAAASPYVVAPGGESPSVAGTNNRYNNIQIDGATTSDIFGLGSSGTPGGQGTAAKPVPLDAIDQFQVLVSPFDVRQTGFTGGLINAVTKSGTNDFHGSVFFQYRNESLVGGDTIRGFGRSFGPPNDFLTRQYGASLGGPIIRDRLHFFVAGEWEDSERPETFDITSDPGVIRVTPAQVDSVMATGQRLGLDLGSGQLLRQEERLGSFLGRLDYRINDNHRVVLRHNATPKWRDDEGLQRNGTNFDLTSYNFFYRTINNSTVLQLFSQLGEGVSNELLANYQTIRDRPTPQVRFSAIEITARGATTSAGRIRAGAEVSRQANELDQNIFQITNNLTLDRGAHRLTAGANAEYYDFRNLFLQGALGTYRFASPTAFNAGNATEYEANVPLRDDINARF